MAYKNYFDRTTIAQSVFQDIATYEAGLTAGQLSEYVERAMDKFHTMHPELQRPVPESLDDFSTLDFDYDIDLECKLWYAWLLVDLDMANKEIADELEMRALKIVNAHSNQGYVIPNTNLVDKRIYSFQLSVNQAYVPMIRSNVTNDVGMRARGYYECKRDEYWIVAIDTGGTITAATYKVSVDGGNSYASTLRPCQLLLNYPSGWLALGYGNIQIKFFANSTTFTVGDTFEIHIRSKTEEKMENTGAIRLNHK